jgi:hypothetical protein
MTQIVQRAAVKAIIVNEHNQVLLLRKSNNSSGMTSCGKLSGNTVQLFEGILRQLRASAGDILLQVRN